MNFLPRRSLFNRQPSSYDIMLSQQAEAAVIPVISNTAANNPTTTLAPKQLQTLTIVIPAGGQFPVQLSGDFLFVQSMAFDNAAGVIQNALTVRPDVGPLIILNSGDKRIRWAQDYSILQFNNPVANGNATLVIVAGKGYYEDLLIATITTELRFGISAVGNATNGAYAINQQVGVAFSFAGIFQLGGTLAKITRARLIKSTNVIANANFTLFMNGASVGDKAAFVLSNVLMNLNGPLIQFPVFITGGAGSNAAECDVAGLDIDLITPTIPVIAATTYPAVLVANAAYNPGAAEVLQIQLFGRQF